MSNFNLEEQIRVLLNTVQLSYGFEQVPDIIENTATKTASYGSVYYCLKAMNGDAVIEVARGINNNIVLSNYTIKDGDEFKCNLKSVKLTSGNVIAYKKQSGYKEVPSADVAPENITAPSVTGTAVVGETLTTTDGTWTGTPEPTFSYQWYRGATLISGATNNTYTLVSADAGQNIKCTVTATNTAGSASADSNTVAIFDTVADSQGAFYNIWSVARLLRGAYYGSPIIRLRRTNDNAESNFGVTTSGVLDESAITSWVGSNSATVVTVYAQDGSARHFTNATPSEQPLFVNAGTIIKRTGAGSGAVARPAMDFDGTKTLSVTTSTALYNFIHNGGFGFVASVAEFGKVSDPNAVYGLVGNYAVSGSNVGFAILYEDRAALPANNAFRAQSANGAGTNTALVINNNAITPQQLHIVTSQFDCDNATANNRIIGYVDNSGALAGNIQLGVPSVANATFNLQWGGGGNNASRLVGYASELIIDNQDRASTNAAVITNLDNFYQTF